MKIDLIKTNDGSHTLYRHDLDETYHSTHGAMQESMHVYINSGLKGISKPVIRIFEVGFGTGLNAILSLIEAEKMKKKLVYDGIEKYPLSGEVVSKLNYTDLLPSEYREIFNKIHDEKWNEELHFRSMSLTKINADIINYTFTGMYDLIYFDAFGPDKQPEVWTSEIFSKIYNAIDYGGILITFSVKGEIRRRLKEVGFLVEKLQGPPGKLQILRAIK